MKIRQLINYLKMYEDQDCDVRVALNENNFFDNSAISTNFDIETRLNIDVELYNMIGEIIEVDNIKRIDLSGYPDGVYNLIITYDKIRITKKIIKL